MKSRAGTLLVFLKYPEPGRVKTRLAAAIGDAAAAKLYRGWIGLVLERVQPVRETLTVIGAIDGADRLEAPTWDRLPACHSSDRLEACPTGWSSLVDGWWPQPAGDLGSRLDAGFREHSVTSPVLAIGTDCLEIEPDIIRQACVILRDRDAVFGPASDGGYYLVGTARHLPGFFDGIRWSGPHTLADHVERCREHGWTFGLLPMLDDIDTWDDWLAYRGRTGRRTGFQPVPTVAVVMPVLNEAAALPATLESLLSQSGAAERIIVVDGGSRDGAAEVASKLGAEVRVAEAAGRGNQIALGVSETTDDLVVVAHADMIFPHDALATIRRYMREHPDCPGGSLGHLFESRALPYRLIEWFDRRRARRDCSYGDQAQFFRRGLLEFPAQPIMEDVELAARLRGLGKSAYLDCPVTVSTRRFEQLGLLRTLWRNWRYRRAYRRGGIAATRAIHEQYYRREEPAR